MMMLKYEDKQSSYAARNEGARNARGDIFLFTDIDCILTESYFKTIINNEFNDSYSLVSGPIEVSIHLNNISMNILTRQPILIKTAS